ncbi:hypothetical protein [Sporisorium scitamineum]|uniref:Uncharacterized protein n=1 Tax=Sporisorium scitamineum TaxID=49012 RepID=A0A0F7SDS5_9BASI|nr:hypothetical protein [Sporisorium scitamineum]
MQLTPSECCKLDAATLPFGSSLLADAIVLLISFAAGQSIFRLAEQPISAW